MYNTQMVGVHNLDRFSLKGCFLVIGCFGIVTLISYFNELAKAGLLSGHPKFKTLPSMGFQRQINDAVHYLREERNLNKMDKVILQKDGDFHQLDLNLLPLGRYGDPGENISDSNDDTTEEEIQIALHLRKNRKYVQSNETKTQIYQLHNTLPNFYLQINESLSGIMNQTHNFSGINRKAVLNFTQTHLRDNLRLYHNRSRVFVYQHDPNGYAARDCFMSLALQKKMVVSPVPLNALNRKKWELMGRSQRERYEILYGSLSFGACEGRAEGCSYAVMMSHPLDRLLQAYWLCRGNSNRTMCRFFDTDNITTIYGFIERHGNSFFHKLLYYSRHCRLIGQDEMCIHDSKIYFVLSRQEKEAYLTDILGNIENWFSVVGLSEHLQESLRMIGGVLALDFPGCVELKHRIPSQFYDIFFHYHYFHPLTQELLANVKIDGVPYFKIREKLLNDTQVASSMSADLEIYSTFSNIFRRQQSVYRKMEKLMHMYFPDQHILDWHKYDSFNDNHVKNISCSPTRNDTSCKNHSSVEFVDTTRHDVTGSIGHIMHHPGVASEHVQLPQDVVTKTGYGRNLSEVRHYSDITTKRSQEMATNTTLLQHLLNNAKYIPSSNMNVTPVSQWPLFQYVNHKPYHSVSRIKSQGHKENTWKFAHQDRQLDFGVNGNLTDRMGRGRNKTLF